MHNDPFCIIRKPHLREACVAVIPINGYVDFRISYDIIIARDYIGMFTIILGRCFYVTYMFQGVIDLGKR